MRPDTEADKIQLEQGINRVIKELNKLVGEEKKVPDSSLLNPKATIFVPQSQLNSRNSN